MKELDARLWDLLEVDDGVDRLVMGLALSNRFHFYSLACDIPRASAIILEILRQRVPRERDETVRFVVLDAYGAHTRILEPIPFELLVTQILTRLVSPSPDERGPDVVFVVDASHAIMHDKPAWQLLFQRMNEARNDISSVLDGPLLLMLPEWLEPVFAHAAPDFWSIRSSAVLVRIPADTLREGSLSSALELSETRETSVAPAESEEGAIDEIEREIAILQERIKENADDSAAEASLALWLTRRLRHEMSGETFEKWLDTSESVLRAIRTWLENHSETPANWTIVLELVREMAKACQRAGDPKQSLRWYEQAVAMGRRACALHPEDETLHAFHWQTLMELANHLSLQSAWLTALELGNEARDIALRFYRRAPENSDWLLPLASSFNGLGDTWRNLNNPAEALAAHEQALVYCEKGRSFEPSSHRMADELCKSHFGKGAAYTRMGAFSLALDALERGTAIAREMLIHDSENLLWLGSTAVGLTSTAVVHAALNNVQRAVETQAEAVTLLRECSQHAPATHRIRLVFALALGDQGGFLERSNNHPLALAHYHEAADAFDQIARANALPPIAQPRLDECRAAITRLEAELDKPSE